MKHWYMLTLVGTDRPGIVAAITQTLFRAGCNLGEASMARLSGNFTIMLMFETSADPTHIRALLAPVAQAYDLHFHMDEIQAHPHQHPQPNVQVVVHGADRAGIVAEVTDALARAGLNILELESEVGGTEDQPIYIMLLEGYAAGGVDALAPVLAPLRLGGIEVRLSAIDALIG